MLFWHFFKCESLQIALIHCCCYTVVCWTERQHDCVFGRVIIARRQRHQHPLKAAPDKYPFRSTESMSMITPSVANVATCPYVEWMKRSFGLERDDISRVGRHDQIQLARTMHIVCLYCSGYAISSVCSQWPLQ